MAKHGHGSSHGIGRDHPASKPIPQGGELSKFGRDTLKEQFPPNDKVPRMGRDHPASKGTDIPGTSDPNPG